MEWLPTKPTKHAPLQATLGHGMHWLVHTKTEERKPRTDFLMVTVATSPSTQASKGSVERRRSCRFALSARHRQSEVAKGLSALLCTGPYVGGP